MKKFMDENFLLQTETAQKLYHEHAAKMPRRMACRPPMTTAATSTLKLDSTNKICAAAALAFFGS